MKLENGKSAFRKKVGYDFKRRGETEHRITKKKNKKGGKRKKSIGVNKKKYGGGKEKKIRIPKHGALYHAEERTGFCFLGHEEKTKRWNRVLHIADKALIFARKKKRKEHRKKIGHKHSVGEKLGHQKKKERSRKKNVFRLRGESRCRKRIFRGRRAQRSAHKKEEASLERSRGELANRQKKRRLRHHKGDIWQKKGCGIGEKQKKGPHSQKGSNSPAPGQREKTGCPWGRRQ